MPSFRPESYPDFAPVPFRLSDDFNTHDSFHGDQDETADWSDFNPFGKENGTTPLEMLTRKENPDVATGTFPD